MPRAAVQGSGPEVRGERTRVFLKQESYHFKGDQSLPARPTHEEEEEKADATSLIKACEAWATEAFRLPADFLHGLSQPGKKKR